MSLLDAPPRPQVLPPIPFFGDSYTAALEANTLPRSNGDSATADRKLRYMELVAARLGTQALPFGVGGSSSWPTSANALGQGSRVTRFINPIPAAPWTPACGVAVIRLSFNDLATAGPAADLTASADSIRAQIDRLRSGGVMEVSNTAFWTLAQNGGASNWGSNVSAGWSGGVMKYAQANLNKWTLTLPADFPGGTVQIRGFKSTAGGGSGSTHTVTVDGSAYGTWDTRGATFSTAYIPTCYQITGLAAGAHTIVGVVSNIVTYDYLNYAQYIAADPPLVVVMLANKLPTYPVGATQNDTAIDNLNTAVTNMIAANYTSRVVTVDTTTALGNKSTAYLNGIGVGDGFHPSMRGHEALAVAVEAKIRANLPSRAMLSTVRSVPMNHVIAPQIAATSIEPRIGSATLAAGTVTITGWHINANTVALLSRKTAAGTALGHLSYAVTASSGTTAGSIVITAKKADMSGTETGDTSVIDYVLTDAA